jgi:hypothetical protein
VISSSYQSPTQPCAPLTLHKHNHKKAQISPAPFATLKNSCMG